MRDLIDHGQFVPRPGSGALEWADGLLADLRQLQLVYGAVHHMPLGTDAEESEICRQRDTAEAMLSLANERLARVIAGVEVHARALGPLISETGPCPTCGAGQGA